jgi:hypothetical protein
MIFVKGFIVLLLLLNLLAPSKPVIATTPNSWNAVALFVKHGTSNVRKM